MNWPIYPLIWPPQPSQTVLKPLPPAFYMNYTRMAPGPLPCGIYMNYTTLSSPYLAMAPGWAGFTKFIGNDITNVLREFMLTTVILAPGARNHRCELPAVSRFR